MGFFGCIFFLLKIHADRKILIDFMELLQTRIKQWRYIHDARILSCCMWKFWRDSGRWGHRPLEPSCGWDSAWESSWNIIWGLRLAMMQLQIDIKHVRCISDRFSHMAWTQCDSECSWGPGRIIFKPNSVVKTADIQPSSVPSQVWIQNR